MRHYSDDESWFKIMQLLASAIKDAMKTATKCGNDQHLRTPELQVTEFIDSVKQKLTVGPYLDMGF